MFALVWAVQCVFRCLSTFLEFTRARESRKTIEYISAEGRWASAGLLSSIGGNRSTARCPHHRTSRFVCFC